MTGLAPGYSVRPGTSEDAGVAVSIEDAYEIGLAGRPYPHIETWVREGWVRPRFDPVRDSWIVIAPDGRPAGYGQVYDEEPHALVEAVARVHPDLWGRGVGSTLVDLMETRAREHVPLSPDGTVRLLNDTVSTDESAHTLLQKRGYVLDRHFWHMYLDLEVPPPDARVPKGIVIRPFNRATDATAVHEVLEEAFTGHYAFAPTPFDRWQQEFLDVPTYDGGLWLVAEEGDRVVGALTGRVMAEDGWIGDLGVLTHARGRGIGAALLMRSFQVFKERGFGTVALNVDAGNETGATALYERVGMKMRRQWDIYLKVLTSASPRAS